MPKDREGPKAVQIPKDAIKKADLGQSFAEYDLIRALITYTHQLCYSRLAPGFSALERENVAFVALEMGATYDGGPSQLGAALYGKEVQQDRH